MKLFWCSIVSIVVPAVVSAQVPPALIAPARLAEIQHVADSLNPQQLTQGVAIRPNPTIPTPAWSRQLPTGSFEVQFNPTILHGFSQTATDLVLYHELGHVHLGHHALLKTMPAKARQFELEADAFAAFIFRRRDRVDQGLIDFLKVVATKTATVPSGPDRLRVFAPLLGIPLPPGVGWR